MLKETISYIKASLGIEEKLSFNQTAHETLDEIVFENREKEYGAYVLRKNYPWHLITAVGLVTSTFLYLCFLPVLLGWLNRVESPTSISVPGCRLGELLPIPSGYKTPPIGKMISLAELEKIKQQISFQIPKPAHPEELFIGNGKDKINTTPNPSVNFSYASIADNSFPLGNWDYLDSLEFEEIITPICDFPKIIEERKEVISELEPSICYCPLVDEEPAPINLDQIRDCIDLPRRQSTSSSNFIFSIQINKMGLYADHKLIQGKNKRIIRRLENCISQLKFTPAIQGGRPVETWVNLPIRVDYVE